MATSSTNPTPAELEEVRDRLALWEQLDKTERPWRLRSKAATLLAAARDTIDLALTGHDDSEPVTEEYAERAADLCEMAVQKCVARRAAKRERSA